jgi:hypothetical protein
MSGMSDCFHTCGRSTSVCEPGAVNGVQKGVPYMVIKRADLAVMATEMVMASSPAPDTWSTAINLMGTVDKLAQFSAAMHAMRRELYGKVLVRIDVRSQHCCLIATHALAILFNGRLLFGCCACLVQRKLLICKRPFESLQIFGLAYGMLTRYIVQPHRLQADVGLHQWSGTTRL